MLAEERDDFWTYGHQVVEVVHAEEVPMEE
jgi:hypothetical protein